jgi:methyl-accepting chemotaxis protein
MTKWVERLTLRAKLTGSYLLVALLAGVVGAVGTVNVRYLSSSARAGYDHNAIPTGKLLDLASSFLMMRVHARDVLLARADRERLNAKIQETRAAARLVHANANSLQGLLDGADEREPLKAFLANQVLYEVYLDSLVMHAQAGRAAAAEQVMSGPLAVIARDQMQAFDGLRNRLRDRAAAAAAEAEERASSAILLMLITAVAGALGAAGLGLWLSRHIGGLLQRLGEIAEGLAAGDLDQKARIESKDELGWLGYSMNKMVKAQKEFAAAVERIAAGDVAATVSPRGEKDVLGRAIQQVQETTVGLRAETVELVAAAKAGDLSHRGNSARFSGAYRELVQGMNDTLDAVLAPVDEAAAILERVARRDLSAEVQGAYQGDHARIKDAVNTAVGEMRRALATLSQSADALAGASEELSAVATQLGASAEETSAQAGVVSAASEQVSKGVQTVSTGTAEMGASIQEIAVNATQAARVATRAHEMAETTNETVTQLGTSSAEIGNVVKVITSIAQQTNLLALNATIEAARAGEAGKGFAVVATEVKELAKATARATEDIGRKIDAIQSDASSAVSAIQEITGIVAQISELQTTIAGAVEEQSVTTREMTRSVDEAARGTGEIAQNISHVAAAAEQTSDGALKTRQAAQELAAMAAQLQALVGQFVIEGAEGEHRAAAAPGNVDGASADLALERRELRARGADRRRPAASRN